MSIKIYKSDQVKERIEASKKFAGTAPMTMYLSEGMEDITIKQLGENMCKNYKGVGVSLISLEFALILDPEEESG